MDRPVLLWVDLTLQRRGRSSTRHFEDYFAIRHAGNRTRLADADSRPDALCFDYDYPDRAGLTLLEQTKEQHPSIPILMLTVQHSEDLAVWAFRARVWDYFVKPVSEHDIERCYESLLRIGTDNRKRDSARITPPLPEAHDVLRKNSGFIALMPAIAYIESHLGEKISESHLAGLCGMNTYRFSRLFREAYGRTFQKYLMSYRVERAVEFLKNPDARISDVAELVGFGDVSYFGRVFRRYHHMTPTQWQSAWQEEQKPSVRAELLYPEPAR